MLALEEEPLAVYVFSPELSQRPAVAEEFAGQTLVDEISAKLHGHNIEVKARKQLLLDRQDAEDFCQHLRPSTAREAAVESFSRGVCEVAVLRHLDPDADVVATSASAADELAEAYGSVMGSPSFFCARTAWECLRYLEFFFPHLDRLPVERTLGLIKPDGLAAGTRGGITLEEDVKARAAAAGLLIVGKFRGKPTQQQAALLCAGMKDARGATGVLVSEPGAVALCLEGRGAVGRWQLLCGPPNAGTARETAPHTLRALWGTDSTSNALHASQSLEEAEQELRAFFPEGALTLQRTLCIVRPDSMANLLRIRSDILHAGFTVLKEKEVQLTEARAMEFYKSQKDSLYFRAMVRDAIAGPCAVLVVCRLEAVNVLKQLMGPSSVNDARRLAPRSLRARYGHDRRRNAVHGSESLEAALLEVRLFFPELGVAPVPDDATVSELFFRKPAVASAELPDLSSAGAMGVDGDRTLQQFLSQGLMALCQARPPTSLEAVQWLSDWLANNSPNAAPAAASLAAPAAASLAAPSSRPVFQPPERTAHRVEHGINKDGLPYAVELKPHKNTKRIIDVDVSADNDRPRVADALPTPPHVVFVLGGPLAGQEQIITRLKEEFNYVHLSVTELAYFEDKAGTFIGTEMMKHRREGTMHSAEGVKTTLHLLRMAMLKHQDTNRFLFDDFPQSLEQAQAFEREIGEVAFILHLEASSEKLQARAKKAAAAGEADVPDAAAVDEHLQAFEQMTLPVLGYYGPIGKVRRIDARKDFKELYAEAKRYFFCRFIYLLGPPGAPLTAMAERLESMYGYAAINFPVLLEQAAQDPDGIEGARLREALAEARRGKAADASVVCPLVLAEVLRSLALGVQNMVLIGFPQSRKQAQFLEHRVPCVARTVLLDFSATDAEELAVGAGGDTAEIETQIAEFYNGAMQDLLRPGPGQLPGLVRLPCGLGPPVGGGYFPKVVDATWSLLRRHVMPSLTLVLGPPCCGTEALAGVLASLKANTQAVDRDLLLERELERYTQAGVSMHAMLERGQVVPFSVTSDLLKGVVSRTCSDSLVVQNCPMYVDQIEYLAKDFRIDRAYCIEGTKDAIEEWRKEYIEGSGIDAAADRASLDFDERVELLRPIAAHFARIGRLQRLEVKSALTQAVCVEEVKKATTPQLAIITGASKAITSHQAGLLAAQCGPGPPITKEFLVNWAQATLSQTVDPGSAKDIFAVLKSYADATGYSLIVLERYPAKPEDVTELLRVYGEPKTMFHFECAEEYLMEEHEAEMAERADDDPPLEPVDESVIAQERAAAKSVYDEFAAKCPAAAALVEWAGEKASEPEWATAHDKIASRINARLRPRVYVIVAPPILSGHVGDMVRASTRHKMARRFATIDGAGLAEPGQRDAALEDRLARASVRSGAPDCLPGGLWADLFRDAFAQSASPTGTFMVTNFPLPPSSPTADCLPIRDQFHALEQAAVVMGILFVKVPAKTYRALHPEGDEGLDAHEDFEEEMSELVNKEGSGQFDAHKVCECILSGEPDVAAAAAKASEDFLSFLDVSRRRK